MPRLPQIATLTVLATLLAGCGSYTPYWQAFFEVGQPASASSLISKSSAASSLSTRLGVEIADMRAMFQEENSAIQNLPVTEARLASINKALKTALDKPPVTDGFGPQKSTPPATLIQRGAQLLTDQREKMVLQRKGLTEKEKPILQEADTLEKICFKPGADKLCSRFSEALSLLRVKSEIMAEGFDRLDDVYQQEVKNQQEISAQYLKKQ
jgi:hypothetical protein